MSIGSIIALVFGLGILSQASFLIHKSPEEKNYMLVKSIGIISFIIFGLCELIAYLYGSSLTQGNSYATFPLYIFYYFACPALVYFNRERVLVRINEFSVLIISVIFIYYSVSWLGTASILSILIYLATAKCAWLIIKKEPSISDKIALYTWYSLLYLVMTLANIIQISLNAYDDILYAKILAYFMMGGVYYCLFVYLVPILYLNNGDNSYTGIMERKKLIDRSGGLYEKTNMNMLVAFSISPALLLVMIINHRNDYISETIMVTALLLLAATIKPRQKPYVVETSKA